MFFECVCTFLQWLPSKHGNLHICRQKTVPKHHVLQRFHFKKSFQNIVVHSVFTMFPVKNTVIYTFFTIKSLQNTNFCMFLQCFQCSGIPKLFKTSLFTRFFHCRSFFHCRKPTKMIKKLIQNDPKFHLHALLSSNTHKSSQNIENTTSLWTRCKNCGLGAKSFLAPPATADIATAILINAIEHLVLLFTPRSTPSPPKRCGRI